MGLIFSFKIGFILMLLNTLVGLLKKRELLALGYKQMIHPNFAKALLGFALSWLVNSFTPMGLFALIRGLVTNTETLHELHIKVGMFEKI